jgi:hypothetical protein
MDINRNRPTDVRHPYGLSHSPAIFVVQTLCTSPVGWTNSYSLRDFRIPSIYVHDVRLAPKYEE